MPTKKQIERLIKINNEYAEKKEKLVNKIIARYVVFLRKEWEKVTKEIIKNWYDSYDPYWYTRRRRSLYKIPHLEVDEDTGDYELSFDANRITGYHRVTRGKKGTVEGGKKYLFETTFVKGWHGGADSGPPDSSGRAHPPGGEPYWRRPYEIYNLWWPVPAARYERNINTDYSGVFEDLEFDYKIDPKDTKHSVRDEIVAEFYRRLKIIESDLVEDFRLEYKKLSNKQIEAWKKTLRIK